MSPRNSTFAIMLMATFAMLTIASATGKNSKGA
jgi:hypothetical protein